MQSMEEKPNNEDIAYQEYKGPSPLESAATGALAAERIGGIAGTALGTVLGGVFYKPLNRLASQTPLLNKLVEKANTMLTRQTWLSKVTDTKMVSAMALGAVSGAIIGRVSGLLLGANMGMDKAKEGATQFSDAQQEIKNLRDTLQKENNMQANKPDNHINAAETSHDAPAAETQGAIHQISA